MNESLDDFFAGKPKARRLFDAFLRFARKLGNFEVIVQKTRISFLAQTRFAGVDRAGDGFIVVRLGLPRWIGHPRLGRPEGPITGWWLYRLRIERVSDLDDELAEWFRESYAMMGLRRRLGRPGRGS